ncbi:aminotransferase class IV family protein [Glaesserella sp.]|uniref:aminotransferase class IV family protein n=1 Tax=Glaesserella sp. TaxID=2094731 RepID=UPI00359FC5DF
MFRYPLFETIAVIDCQFQNIEFHQERINYAFKYYLNSESKFNLEDILKRENPISNGLIRCKVEYNSNEYNIRFYHYSPKTIRRLQTVYTNHFDYRFKYSDRRKLESLKSAMPDTDEIIIINNGFVSDCTIGNLLFLKQGTWYSSDKYLLKGTQLSKLIQQNKVILTEIRAENLLDYEQVMMINALNPFDETRTIPVTSGLILR